MGRSQMMMEGLYSYLCWERYPFDHDTLIILVSQTHVLITMICWSTLRIKSMSWKKFVTGWTICWRPYCFTGVRTGFPRIWASRWHGELLPFSFIGGYQCRLPVWLVFWRYCHGQCSKELSRIKWNWAKALNTLNCTFAMALDYEITNVAQRSI